MKAVKYSRQRELIKNYLMSRTDRPTAEAVYEAIREVCPNISLGTVYRNLTFLVDQGEVIRLSCGEDRDRFDANISKHYHFICKKCGCVKDLKMLSIDHIDDIAGDHFDGQIEGHYAYFYGLCGQCMAQEQTAVSGSDEVISDSDTQ